MRVLPAELFVRTAAKNCLEDDSLIGTTSATINFKSIAHKHPTSSQITKSITSRGLPAFWLLPTRKDQLYGTPNLWPFCNDPNCFYQIYTHKILKYIALVYAQLLWPAPETIWINDGRDWGCNFNDKKT